MKKNTPKLVLNQETIKKLGNEANPLAATVNATMITCPGGVCATCSMARRG